MAGLNGRTSAYRDDAERWRKRADEQPGEEGLTPEQWRQICLMWADAYAKTAERHEAAIAAGREAEDAFWHEGRAGL
jgi:hypothetical protein